MDTVSNYPAVLASTREDGDTSDSWVAAQAAAHDAAFAVSREQAHASRDIVRDVWATSKGNVCATHDAKFELERSIKEQELRTQKDIGELKLMIAAQALSDAKEKRLDDQLGGISVALRALAEAVARLPRV